MSQLISGIPVWLIPILILFLSIIALTIILERGWSLLQRIKSLNVNNDRQLIKYIKEKAFEEAASFSRLQMHPAYKVILAIFEAKDSDIDLKNIAQEETLRQSSSLEKYLPTLGTISTVAPLIGLLGTVTGMIKSFKAFGVNTSRNVQLMGGIDEALITTALGLIVAIPALVMYNYYVRRVSTILEETNILIDMVLKELAKVKSKRN